VNTRILLPLLAAALAAGCLGLGGPEGAPPGVEVVAEDLDTPWALAHAPDGRTPLTERPGQIRVVDADGTLRSEPWADVAAAEVGESGLMGLALHPDFPTTPHVFVSSTVRDADGDLENRLHRLTAKDGSGSDTTTLIEGIPAGSIHDGSRLRFGPDGYLWMTTGEAGEPDRAQDPDTLAGKVLRLTTDGEAAPGNPNGSRWYTLGHRNPQGLDFHPETGVPYVSEHGPENHDEVNRLEAGGNYGWPEHRGPNGAPENVPSIWTSGADGTVAPAGAALVDAPDSPLHGAFAMVTLKASQLHVFQVENGSVVAEDVLFEEDFGRLRAAKWHDDALWITTSNRDGRGVPADNDDRLVRVPLELLEARVDWA
jgi:glucose/arabinose dehydrogenase